MLKGKLNLSRSRISALFFLTVLAGSLYLNSLDNSFTNWDDQMIYGNEGIRSLDWKNLCRIFTPVKAGTYQPIRVLSYAVDYYFWRLDPFGYHITNVFLYILTCITVFFTIEVLSKQLRRNVEISSHLRVAFFGSLLFTAHPVHVEAVTWLAARKEVLQGFFFFLAFYLYVKGRETEGRKRLGYLSGVILFFLLAALSKPSAIVFPAVLLVYEIALQGRKWTDFLKRHWVFFGISSLFSLFIASVLMKVMVEAGGIKPYWGGSFINNVITSFHVFLYNIKLLVFTINYSAAYTIPIPGSALSLRSIAFVGITLLLVGGSLWSLRWNKVFFFSFFFFWVTLLPYLNLVPISTLLADRYVFIASFSYAFLVGIFFDRFYGLRNKMFSEHFFKLLSTVVFLFLLTGYALMTMRQNQIWENSFTLWADAVEKYPESNTANALMGVVYMEMGLDEKAVPYLEKAVQILPQDYHSRNNLGIVYGNLGEPEKALKELLTAIWLSPDDEGIKINLSVFYQKQKEYKKSEGVLRYLLSRDPNSANLYFRLGLLYKEMGQYDAAISNLIKAMELAPHIVNPYQELGHIYLEKKKDIEKAKYYYSRGVEAAPGVKDKLNDLKKMIEDQTDHR